MVNNPCLDHPMPPTVTELVRLQRLLPTSLAPWVDIFATGKPQSSLITSRHVNSDRHEIELDLPRWQTLPLDSRNLLFWHQVARIQLEASPKEGWEKSGLFIGLGAMTGELWVQEGWLFISAAILASICAYRIYKRRRRSLNKALTYQADLQAIKLAQQFGYPPSVARHHLSDALAFLQSQTPNFTDQQQYRDRLTALSRAA